MQGSDLKYPVLFKLKLYKQKWKKKGSDLSKNQAKREVPIANNAIKSQVTNP